MRRYAYALAAAILLSTTVPVMAEETGTEVETIIEVESEEETGTEVETTIEVESEEESATGGAEGTDRASEIQNLLSKLDKQIAELKAELQTLRGDNVVKEGDIVYQDDYVILTYTGLTDDEYSDGYSINFSMENLTDQKITVMFDEESLNDYMFYSIFSANMTAHKKATGTVDLYPDDENYCSKDELESFEFSVAVVDSDTYDEINVSDPVTMYFGK